MVVAAGERRDARGMPASSSPGAADRSAVQAAPAVGTGAQDRLVPALLAAYRHLDGVRYDYPVVLSGDPARPVVSSLASHVDRALTTVAQAHPDPGLRVAAYRVEALVGRLAEGSSGPAPTLGHLWQQAGAEIVAGFRDAGRREALALGLDALAAELPGCDTILPCSADAAERIAIQAWHRRRAELARHDAAGLDDLAGRVTDVLAADLAESPAAAAADALRASMGGSAGFDFGALSSMLQGTRRYHEPPPARTVRLRTALAAIEAARRRLGDPAAALGMVPAADQPAAQASCAAALEMWHAEVGRRVAVVRAVRIANLELQNRYRPDRHDALFDSFGVDQLTMDEHRALPPLLVCLHGDRLDDAEKSTLLEVLAGDIPVKVFLALRTIPGPARPGVAGAPEEWSARIGEVTAALGEAFVVQAPVSGLPGLAGELAGLFAHPGPGLLAVYVPDQASGLPAYVQAAAAAEGRVFPSLVCDPGRGATSAERLSLAANSQAGERWPSHELRYEDAEGGAVEEPAAFTAADFLALDPRFRAQFHLDPDVRRNGRLVPLAEHLAGAQDPAGLARVASPAGSSPTGAPGTGGPAGSDAGPFVFVVDGSDRLHRAVVGPELVAYTRRIAARWERLQDLATPRRVVGTPAVEAATPPGEGGADEARDAGTAASGVGSPGSPALAADAPPATAPSGGGPSPAALDVAPSAVAAVAGAPSIDSAFCTACNECTQRNGRLFAYNDAKQAYIRDPRGGTFRDLVEAAENCPVCIIHPGAPLDPSESGLDDLVARAAALN